ncbi:N-acyl homoserine lactonase family protein [Phenylobacterium sp.]|jgi:glyoxylase-like metal-dependent hydrolase (beta-lactamase superfamily II)|uniref:N-acyl homoserine lactonase family protein n=1 Tax=Phenylobacterium sp. TaxID=1871053 RepID=UPI002E317EE1|nr:N-acyl homoserine lactonase family protein [Phenylobacterium sp.]HEX4713138.1 N-acyl homoserine lactonase family protein [Phenylobacterium sp.]
MRLFGCVCGQFHSPAQGMGMTGGRVEVPVPFYVIEHPDGVALFDCGLHAALEDPEDSYRRRLRRQDLDVSFGPEDTVTRHLERLDIDPARVRYVVLSHLHFDHAGGLHQVPNATLVVQRQEWAAGFDEQMAGRYFLPKRFFDLGHAVQIIDGEHDLFGDGSVTCIPSFGHTPGHQSLRVCSAQGDHILVSDACYNSQVVKSRNFPDYSDHAAMNRSLDGLLALRGPRTVMIFGHDPDQWGEKALLPSLRT